MAFESCEFVNELGNKILMTIDVNDEGVTISATGPTSTVEHTWTNVEAFWLSVMLQSRPTTEDEPGPNKLM